MDKHKGNGEKVMLSESRANENENDCTVIYCGSWSDVAVKQEFNRQVEEFSQEIYELSSESENECEAITPSPERCGHMSEPDSDDSFKLVIDETDYVADEDVRSEIKVVDVEDNHEIIISDDDEDEVKCVEQKKRKPSISVENPAEKKIKLEFAGKDLSDIGKIVISDDEIEATTEEPENFDSSSYVICISDDDSEQFVPRKAFSPKSVVKTESNSPIKIVAEDKSSPLKVVEEEAEPSSVQDEKEESNTVKKHEENDDKSKNEEPKQLKTIFVNQKDGNVDEKAEKTIDLDEKVEETETLKENGKKTEAKATNENGRMEKERMNDVPQEKRLEKEEEKEPKILKNDAEKGQKKIKDVIKEKEKVKNQKNETKTTNMEEKKPKNVAEIDSEETETLKLSASKEDKKKDTKMNKKEQKTEEAKKEGKQSENNQKDENKNPDEMEKKEIKNDPEPKNKKDEQNEQKNKIFEEKPPVLRKDDTKMTKDSQQNESEKMKNVGEKEHEKIKDALKEKDEEKRANRKEKTTKNTDKKEQIKIKDISAEKKKGKQSDLNENKKKKSKKGKKKTKEVDDNERKKKENLSKENVKESQTETKKNEQSTIRDADKAMNTIVEKEQETIKDIPKEKELASKENDAKKGSMEETKADANNVLEDMEEHEEVSEKDSVEDLLADLHREDAEIEDINATPTESINSQSSTAEKISSEESLEMMQELHEADGERVLSLRQRKVFFHQHLPSEKEKRASKKSQNNKEMYADTIMSCNKSELPNKKKPSSQEKVQEKKMKKEKEINKKREDSRRNNQSLRPRPLRLNLQEKIQILTEQKDPSYTLDVPPYTLTYKILSDYEDNEKKKGARFRIVSDYHKYPFPPSAPKKKPVPKPAGPKKPKKKYKTKKKAKVVTEEPVPEKEEEEFSSAEIYMIERELLDASSPRNMPEIEKNSDEESESMIDKIQENIIAKRRRLRPRVSRLSETSCSEVSSVVKRKRGRPPKSAKLLIRNEPKLSVLNDKPLIKYVETPNKAPALPFDNIEDARINTKKSMEEIFGDISSSSSSSYGSSSGSESDSSASESSSCSSDSVETESDGEDFSVAVNKSNIESVKKLSVTVNKSNIESVKKLYILLKPVSQDEINNINSNIDENGKTNVKILLQKINNGYFVANNLNKMSNCDKDEQSTEEKRFSIEEYRNRKMKRNFYPTPYVEKTTFKRRIRSKYSAEKEMPKIKQARYSKFSDDENKADTQREVPSIKYTVQKDTNNKVRNQIMRRITMEQQVTETLANTTPPKTPPSSTEVIAAPAKEVVPTPVKEVAPQSTKIPSCSKSQLPSKCELIKIKRTIKNDIVQSFDKNTIKNLGADELKIIDANLLNKKDTQGIIQECQSFTNRHNPSPNPSMGSRSSASNDNLKGLLTALLTNYNTSNSVAPQQSPSSVKSSASFSSTNERMSSLFACHSFLEGQCHNRRCQYKHELPSEAIVREKLQALSIDVILSSYNYVAHNNELFLRYFPTFCIVFGSKKMGYQLMKTIQDCEQSRRPLTFYKHIVSGLVATGMTLTQAVFVIIQNHRKHTFQAIDVIVSLILDTEHDIAYFIQKLIDFYEIKDYTFTIDSINRLIAYCFSERPPELVRLLVSIVLKSPNEELVKLNHGSILMLCLTIDYIIDCEEEMMEELKMLVSRFGGI